MSNNKILMVRPTKSGIQSCSWIWSISLFDDGKSWILDTETSELKAPFIKIVVKDLYKMFEDEYLKIKEIK